MPTSTATWARASASTPWATMRRSCRYITQANVACGFHGSDPNHMRADRRAGASDHGVRVGAHVSLPDLAGFGRREMKIGREETAEHHSLPDRRADGLSANRPAPLSPHQAPWRALRHGGASQAHIAEAVADAALVYGVPVMGHVPDTLHETVYRARGVGFPGRVLRRSRLRRRRQADHHRESRCGRSGRLPQNAPGSAVLDGNADRRREARRCRCAPRPSASIPTRPTPSRSPRRCAHSSLASIGPLMSAKIQGETPWT